jgi:hypothetical protein
VCDVIPDGFAAYARVFHPLSFESHGAEREVRWHEIASANGRSLAEEVQALQLSQDPSEFSRSGERLWTTGAEQGSMPLKTAQLLVDVLRPHTDSPEHCWFGLWEGWADDLPDELRSAAVLQVPERHMYLHEGTIDDALRNLSSWKWRYRSPNLWWPDDRRWCVATAIDFRWTYVGGSSECVTELLSNPSLEGVRLAPNEGHLMNR